MWYLYTVTKVCWNYKTRSMWGRDVFGSCVINYKYCVKVITLYDWHIKRSLLYMWKPKGIQNEILMAIEHIQFNITCTLIYMDSRIRTPFLFRRLPFLSAYKHGG
jgi:hypothetical protein